jgi:threonine/homoserine/homoserine lactone efflux protein
LGTAQKKESFVDLPLVCFILIKIIFWGMVFFVIRSDDEAAPSWFLIGYTAIIVLTTIIFIKLYLHFRREYFQRSTERTRWDLQSFIFGFGCIYVGLAVLGWAVWTFMLL